MIKKHGILLGRLVSDLQSDHGILVHCVIDRPCKRPPCPFNDFGRKSIPNDNYSAWIGLCGAKPGKRSVGWSYVADNVTCPKCLAKLAKAIKN